MDPVVSCLDKVTPGFVIVGNQPTIVIAILKTTKPGAVAVPFDQKKGKVHDRT